MKDVDPFADRVLTVAEVSALVREVLEGTFPRISVEGEVVGFRVASSGHAYFSLTEKPPGETSTLTLECVLYRFARAAQSVIIQNGKRIVAKGRLSAWAGSGGSRYQLVVQAVREAGQGDLLRRLEDLKRRLAAEGLFDASRKRPLPFWPRRIGVVTSLQGAAVRDIVRTALGRFPARILIAPSLVQGEGAAEAIVQGIAALNRIPDVDVIIVGRGGGAMEDLWAFNEEAVVRAVAGSRVPVVSAVGHEVDHVLSDEAADWRAPTPTAAGQAVVPDISEIRATLLALESRLRAAAQRSLDQAARRLDDAEVRLRNAGSRLLTGPRHALALIVARLHARHPARTLREERRHLVQAACRLVAAGQRLLEPKRHRLESLSLRLRALDPFGPLERGYALARTRDGAVVQRYTDVSPGDWLDLWLGSGALDCVVQATRAERERGG